MITVVYISGRPMNNSRSVNSTRLHSKKLRPDVAAAVPPSENADSVDSLWKFSSSRKVDIGGEFFATRSTGAASPLCRCSRFLTNARSQSTSVGQLELIAKEAELACIGVDRRLLSAQTLLRLRLRDARSAPMEDPHA